MIFANLVSWNGTNANWDVTDLVEALTLAVSAAIIVAGVVLITFVGLRWIFREIRGDHLHTMDQLDDPFTEVSPRDWYHSVKPSGVYVPGTTRIAGPKGPLP